MGFLSLQKTLQTFFITLARQSVSTRWYLGLHFKYDNELPELQSY